MIKGRLEDAAPGALPDAAPGDAPVAAAPAKSRAGRAPKTTRTATAAKPAKRTRAAKPARPRPRQRSRQRAAARTPPRSRARARPRHRRSRTRAAEALQLLLDDGPDDDLDGAISGASLTRAELAAGAGLTEADLLELEEYGLLEPAAGDGDRVLFDEEALGIAQLCAAFAKHGIEPRHLRMYRSFAEREAMLYGQVVAPVMRQRNPEARVRARDDLVELAQLGRGLRTAFLRRAVGGLVAD